MKRLRLVKVIVQPVFAIDDGETLTESPSQQLVIPATEWPDFAERLETERQEHEITLNADEPTA